MSSRQFTSAVHRNPEATDDTIASSRPLVCISPSCVSPRIVPASSALSGMTL
jgi:hypothetical protein